MSIENKLARIKDLQGQKSKLMEELSKSIAIRKAFGIDNALKITIKKSGTVYQKERGELTCQVFNGEDLIATLPEYQLKAKLEGRQEPRFNLKKSRL